MSTVVVDASTLVDALLPGPHNRAARTALADAEVLAAPEHLGVEVISVLRRLSRRNPDLDPVLATARRTLVELRLDLIALHELQERIWELRHTLSAYDAAYLAAAEHFGADLLTRDTALLEHPDRRCQARDPASEDR